MLEDERGDGQMTGGRESAVNTDEVTPHSHISNHSLFNCICNDEQQHFPA